MTSWIVYKRAHLRRLVENVGKGRKKYAKNNTYQKVDLLKRSVYKFNYIIKTNKIFNVNNMMDLDELTSLI